MELIAEMEPSPRGVYTGAIGCVLPGGDFLFNVAIRTIERANGEATIGIGGGIVADSDPVEEWNEALLKSRFATEPPLPRFDALETILWKRRDASDMDILEGCHLLDRHLERMAKTQRRFDRRWDAESALEALRKTLGGLPEDADYARIRLLSGPSGHCDATAVPLEKPGWPRVPLRLVLAERDERGVPAVLLRHKTTCRWFHDGIRRKALGLGYDEAIEVNAKGEIAEGTISSVFAKIDGKWKTPALESGLLPGIWRAETIERLRAEETVILPEDLRRAEMILVGNSVRGGAEGMLDSAPPLAFEN
jgi:para-aminobenzoate synthetase/4-amino-4-deoxychorismate lyase